MTNNLAASVRARLLNVARETGTPFQEILTRYGMERTLYRLQQSGYTDEFILKGAMLFLDWTNELHRPTRDIDVLKKGSSEVDDLESTFETVINTEVEPDGLDYDTDSVRGTEIREDAVYRGIRIKLDAFLDSARISVQVDVGFGDAVVPVPTSIEIPALLEFPSPQLTGYTRYTAVAEKFEAMLKLGEINSRMKDYYDISTLCRHFAFDGPTLKMAMEATCTRRQTSIPDSCPTAITPRFADISGKQSQWTNFADKLRKSPSPPFEDVLGQLQQFLWPPAAAINNNGDFTETWSPGGPWQ